MEAKNYRVGNYLQSKSIGKFCMVEGVEAFPDGTKFKILGSVYCSTDVSSDLEDIPLTEEWLFKFGFIERMNRGFSRFYISVLGTDFYMRPCCYGGFYWGFVDEEGLRDFEFPFARPLMYVHELQNLYFAITGEELLLKEENA